MRRATPLRWAATLAAAALATGAQAAAVALYSVGHEVLLCRVEHRCAHGNAFVATPAWQWVVGSPPQALCIVDAMIRSEGVWPGWGVHDQLDAHDYRFVADLPAASSPR